MMRGHRFVSCSYGEYKRQTAPDAPSKDVVSRTYNGLTRLGVYMDRRRRGGSNLGNPGQSWLLFSVLLSIRMKWTSACDLNIFL